MTITGEPHEAQDILGLIDKMRGTKLLEAFKTELEMIQEFHLKLKDPSGPFHVSVDIVAKP